MIALAAMAAYYNSFAGVFVFDDHGWIEITPTFGISGRSGRCCVRQTPPSVGGRPVVSLTLAVNYALGGANVWGYHAMNLAIHVLAAWTLFGVLRRTLAAPPSRSLRARRHALGPGRPCSGWSIRCKPSP